MQTHIIEPTAEIEIQSLDNQVEFELDTKDVRWVFEEFGAVKSVSIQRRNIAHVKMHTFKEMHEAITFLNFKQLWSNARLTVKWAFDDVKEVQRVIKNDETF